MKYRRIICIVIAVAMLLLSLPVSAVTFDTTPDYNLPSYSDSSDDEVIGEPGDDDCFPEPTEPVFDASEDEASIIRLLGDADNNDAVNIKDATIIQKHIAILATIDEVSLVVADADQNGRVNIKDSTIIQKFIAGMRVDTYIGEDYVINPDTNRYYFYMPEDWLNAYTAKTGNTAGIYWWEGTNSHKSWPGIPAKKGDVEGVYYYDVPKDVTTIIWNNYLDGGADVEQPVYKMAAQTVNIGTEYYDPFESDLYPYGTENFDGMIYVTMHEQISTCCSFNGSLQCMGEWFYYYGNGEYGTAPVRGDSKILTGKTVDIAALNQDNTPTKTYRYYFYMPEDWLNKSTELTGNKAGVYWWEGTASHAQWPGIPAKKGDVEGVYYYDLPTDVTKIIWNNYLNGGVNSTASSDYYKAYRTGNISLEGYAPSENDFYPDGIDTFDKMIYVLDYYSMYWLDQDNDLVYYGEWFYYYGNGEYGLSPVKGESEVLSGEKVDLDSLLDRLTEPTEPEPTETYPEPTETYPPEIYPPQNPDPPEVAPSGTLKVNFINSGNWDGVKVKLINTKFERIKMEDMVKTEETVNGYEIYTYETDMVGNLHKIVFYSSDESEQSGWINYEAGWYYDYIWDVWYKTLDDVPETLPDNEDSNIPFTADSEWYIGSYKDCMDGTRIFIANSAAEAEEALSNVKSYIPVELHPAYDNKFFSEKSLIICMYYVDISSSSSTWIKKLSVVDDTLILYMNYYPSDCIDLVRNYNCSILSVNKEDIDTVSGFGYYKHNYGHLVAEYCLQIQGENKTMVEEFWGYKDGNPEMKVELAPGEYDVQIVDNLSCKLFGNGSVVTDTCNRLSINTKDKTTKLIVTEGGEYTFTVHMDDLTMFRNKVSMSITK